MINDNCQANNRMKNYPTSHEKHHNVKSIKAQVQTKIRVIQNQWWIEKAEEIQSFADRRDMRNFSQSSKELYGPWPNLSVPLKSAI